MDITIWRHPLILNFVTRYTPIVRIRKIGMGQEIHAKAMEENWSVLKTPKKKNLCPIFADTVGLDTNGKKVCLNFCCHLIITHQYIPAPIINLDKYRWSPISTTKSCPKEVVSGVDRGDVGECPRSPTSPNGNLRGSTCSMLLNNKGYICQILKEGRNLV